MMTLHTQLYSFYYYLLRVLQDIPKSWRNWDVREIEESTYSHTKW